MRLRSCFPLALLLVACSADPTQLVVVVDSDMAVPSELDRAELEVLSPDGASYPADALLTAADELPRTLVLLHRGGALGPVSVTARGLRSGLVVVERRARITFVPGKTRVLRIHLLRECVGQMCGADQTCAAVGCRDVVVREDELRPWEGTPPPLANTDGGVVPDAGDAGDGGCVLATEVCNGRDDNCDGVADEGFDLNSDPLNCGACGAVCPDALHATGRCAAGSCTTACAAGFFDCNGNGADGCEAELATVSSCGACGVICDLAFADEVCVSSLCEIASCALGHADCDGLRANGCEASTSSPQNCGSCMNACPADPPHAASACDGTGCTLACDLGFADCDGDPMNGCEASLSATTSCGGCGVICVTPTASCQPSAGTFACASSCALGLTDCAGSCVDLTNDASHCGSCPTACSAPPAAVATCTASTCSFRCDPGRADCNMVASDGCEEDLASLSDCGSCGAICAPDRATPSCLTGSCAIASCDAGYGDCNASPVDGCETQLTTASDCGACRNPCSGGTPDCVAGSCVAPIDRVVQLAVGVEHVCARHAAGSVECWGRGNKGQLGDGSMADRLTPVLVMGLSDAVDVAAGRAHACAATGGGAALCWGDNGKGQLGDGTNTSRQNPVGVMSAVGTPLSGVTHVAAGADHSCAVDAAGLHCWGKGGKGQLGDGTGGDHPYATRVAWPASAGAPVDVTAGDAFTCALDANGRVWCFGLNNRGQLGDGTTRDRRLPVAVSGLTDAVEVVAGATFACARRADTTVVCWGDNRQAQLGDGTVRMRTAPVTVVSVSSAASIAAASQHACVALSTGAAMCWGRGAEGQLGDGMRANSPTPVIVTGLVDASGIATGGHSSCSWVSTGGAVCWGLNGRGQLGDGTTTRRLSPTPVASLP